MVPDRKGDAALADALDDQLLGALHDQLLGFRTFPGCHEGQDNLGDAEVDATCREQTDTGHVLLMVGR